MTEVAANYSISKTEVTANNTKIKGHQSAEVDAILKAVRDDKIWKSMGEFKCGEKIATADLKKIMLGGGPAPGVGPQIPTPELVDPNDPHAIEVAMWAVDEYNRLTGSDREYVALLGGVKWKIFQIGTVYALFIDNKDENHEYVSLALVLELAVIGSKSRFLLFWTDVFVN